MCAVCEAAKRQDGKGRQVPPSIRAFAVQAEDGRAVHLVFQCPWCETQHQHGAAGGGGNRGPHCVAGAASPFRQTGYDLDIAGNVSSHHEVAPNGVFVGDRRLYQVLDQAAGALRAVLLRYLIDVKTVRGPVLQRRRPEGNVWIFGSKNWLIEPRGRIPIEGQGFLRLAAALYGVPAGVVAVRLLETLSFDRMDAQAALEVQNAVDAWIARGAPSRLDF